MNSTQSLRSPFTLKMQLALTIPVIVALAVGGLAATSMHRLNAKIGEDIEFGTPASLRVARRLYLEAFSVANSEKNAAEQPDVI